MNKKIALLIILPLLLASGCATTKAGLLTKKSSFPKNIKKEFTLRFVGDAILAISIDHYVKKYGKKYPLKKLTNYLSSADYTIANLESCYTTNGKPYKQKKYTFRAHPSYMEIIKKAGIDATSLANNHLLDFGQKGMQDTIQALQKWKVKGFGAGKNLTAAIKPLTIKIKGTTVHIFSFCDIRPKTFYATKKRAGTAPYSAKLIIKQIKKWKRRNNIVIVSPHWGWELYPYPLKRHTKDARQFIDAGCDAIIGHHPHVPQSIETYKNKPIVYSLGNFIVGYYNYGYRNNIGVTVHCKGEKIKKLTIHAIAGRNLKTGFQPYILKGFQAKKTIYYLKKISAHFKTKIRYHKNGTGTIEYNNKK